MGKVPLSQYLRPMSGNPLKNTVVSVYKFRKLKKYNYTLSSINLFEQDIIFAISI